MYKGFVRLRGVYIKLGQILSIMGTFLPRSYTEELEGLQDEVPAHRYATIAKAFEKALRKSPKAAFASSPDAMDGRFDRDHAAWVISEQARLAAEAAAAAAAAQGGGG